MCGYQTCILVLYSFSHWDTRFIVVLVLLIGGSFDWWQGPKKWNQSSHSNMLGVQCGTLWFVGYLSHQEVWKKG
jgi:hypothetical protein